jgi:predicted nucleic acid-binding protein
VPAACESLAAQDSSQYPSTVRIYLNTSALNRPFDDLSVAKVRIEAEAVLLLVAEIEAGRAELVSSEYLLFEVTQTPDADRARRVMTLVRLSKTLVNASPAVVSRAHGLERLGLRGLDALHIASAEVATADLLITTDDRMLRRARRAAAQLQVNVVTPVQGLARLLVERE